MRLHGRVLIGLVSCSCSEAWTGKTNLRPIRHADAHRRHSRGGSACQQRSVRQLCRCSASCAPKDKVTEHPKPLQQHQLQLEPKHVLDQTVSHCNVSSVPQMLESSQRWSVRTSRRHQRAAAHVHWDMSDLVRTASEQIHATHAGDVLVIMHCTISQDSSPLLPCKSAGLSRRHMMAWGVLATAAGISAEPAAALATATAAPVLVQSAAADADVDLVWSPK